MTDSQWPPAPASAARVAGIVDRGGDVSTLLEGMTTAERRWLTKEFTAGRLARRFDFPLRNVKRWCRIRPGLSTYWHTIGDTP